MTGPEREGRRTSDLPMPLLQALESGSFDRALRAAIADSRLKLATIERRLIAKGHPVARSTLSYWQRGQRQPERSESHAALAALEGILDVPKDSLSRLVGPPKPRGRWIGYRPGGLEWTEMWENPEAVGRVLAAGGRRANNRLEEVSVYDSFSVGADRKQRWYQVQQLVRAREDDADRYVALHRTNPDVDVREIKLQTIENCRPGRVRVVPEAQLVAFEILLGRSLRKGQSHIFTFRLDLPESTLTTTAGRRKTSLDDEFVGRVFRNPIHFYLLRGEFAPGTLPVRAYWIRRARQSTPDQRVEELPLTAEHTVHFSLESEAPSAQGIRWEWE